MNDRKDRPENSGRPRRTDGGNSRNSGNNQRRSDNGYRGNRNENGERHQYRGDRNEGGERRQYRGDREDRGGYRSDRNRRDDRGRNERSGYSQDRNGSDERRPYRGDREQNGEKRPYRSDQSGDRRPRRDDAGERRPYRGDRDDRGYRSDRNDRGGYRKDRNERSGYRSDQDSRGRGGTRGGGRSDRGGQGREYTEEERLKHSLRPVRSEHEDPIIADHIQASDLHPSARNELKTLDGDVQELVARHLAMVALLIDDNPELAHQHAISASRRAGRIPVARETLALTAYRTGDFALAIRELRTYRRLSGRDTNIAIMVDSERGLGRPEKAIETGLEVDRSKLETLDRVHLAIAMSGARLDLGQTQQALFELEIPELNPNKAFSWSPELFGAYGAVLEDLGRTEEAATWFDRADRAAAALEDHFGGLDELEVVEIREHDYLLEAEVDAKAEAETEAPVENPESSEEE